jgi:hypothetical protein
MLRIQRDADKGVVFSLTGRIEAEDIVEIQRLLDLEATGQDISFDLRDITLADRVAVKFLARCQAKKITLKNCPAYIREWIDAEKGGSNRRKS